MAKTRVAIMGGGIGGLACALALDDASYELTIVERDPPPPEIDPLDAFERWQRPGVPQFRHAHILLARLQTTVRDRHPALLDELLRAGLELSKVEQVLSPSQYTHLSPRPEDRDLLHLWGRRPTFEYIMRRYVGRLPHVHFIHEARVTGLIAQASATQLRVQGIEIARSDSEHERLEADLVIDASGNRSKSPEWLRALGVNVETEAHPSGFVYACRHYRLKNPQDSPPRRDGGGNLDFLGYATFYAERGHYALTFGCPVEETELADAIRRPEGFDALCAQVPVFARWTKASEVESKVLGAGRFENRWTHYHTKSGLELLGFFAVGDAQIQTNPMYGRGCAFAFVQATVLAEVLRESSDPSRRAQRYYARTFAELKHYFDLSVTTDRMYRARARMRRGLQLPASDRFLSWAYESVWLPAVSRSPLMAREFWKSMQMRELSNYRTRLAVFFILIAALVRALVQPRRAPSGPTRADFLGKLNAALSSHREPALKADSSIP